MEKEQVLLNKSRKQFNITFYNNYNSSHTDFHNYV